MQKMLKFLYRGVRKVYRRVFQYRTYVFKHTGPFPLSNNLPCEIEKYSKFSDIPDKIKDTFIRDGDKRILENNKRQMENNAVLYVGLIDEKVASVQFARKGKYIKKWYVNINDEDIVLFKAITYPEYRGRGLAPAMTVYAMNDNLKTGDAAYCDCRVFNKSSERAITKAGFQKIAVKKTLK